MKAFLLRPLRVPILVWVLLLTAAGVLYYGAYYRCGFLVSDEGSAALLSLRLLQGERPFADMELGYNVLWFYPITALFSLFGPTFTGMRIWFFALSILSALVAFLSLRKFTGRDFPGLVAAILVLAIPGSNYKSYIPLAIIANVGCMLWIAARAQRGEKLAGAAVAAGIALGLTTLTRIDLGYPLLALWMVYAAAMAWFTQKGRRFTVFLGLAACIAGPATATHLPFYAVARGQNWDAAWGKKYQIILKMYVFPVRDLIGRVKKEAEPKVETKSAPLEQDAPKVPQTGNKAPSAAPPADRHGWARAEFRSIWAARKPQAKVFGFLTYAPLAAVLLTAAAAGMHAFRHRTSPGAAKAAGLAAAALATLAAFPQFFFFRPDVPHLAEYMPGLVVAGIGGVWFFTRRECRARIPGMAALALLLAVIGAWGWFGIQATPAGGILQRAGMTDRFTADNGVDVWVTAQQATWLNAVYDFTKRHSTEKDFMVCYPYWPGLNFMTNRRTYEYNLFVDNTTAGRTWAAKALDRMHTHQPAIVIINDWAANRTDASRFSNYARPLVDHLEANHSIQRESEGFRMFALPARSTETAPN